ncbi:MULTISPECIES: EamA family transporter [Actinomadura]|uniref:EamA family transporter n=1 Tax=Actinomadura yumaensis TaxID=111807 RepID=A0ABW2CCS8_9ACTN|nr:EamA family transporter [Actinomadura sp. J1-007]MWK38070.1 EamA family transporter [Actinomadura sp. J1-007]
MTAALAVIFAGVLHATWNAMAKGAADRWVSFALIGAGQALLTLPLLPFLPAPDAAAVPYLAASVAVHLVYMGLLLKSYELGDFSQVYPLARGSAPLAVALVAAVFLGERLSWAQFGGVAAVCGGLGVLAFAGGLRPGSRREPKAVAAALLTGASIASYTLLDGIGVREAGSAASYTAWLFAIEGPVTVAALWAVRRSALHRGLAVRQVATGLGGGVIAMAGYGIVLWAQTRGALASVAALRETGVISGAVIGAVFFGEHLGKSRIAAACVVAAGVVLITAH